MATGYSQSTSGWRQAPRNKFAGRCADCGEWTDAGAGYVAGKDESTGRWRVRCAGCEPEPEPRYQRQWQPPPRSEPPPRNDPPPQPDFANDPIVRELREAHAARLAFLRAELAKELATPACLRLLGLRPPVTKAQVKEAYWSLAKRHHPDCGGDARQFIAIEDAYRQALGLCAA